MHLIRPQWDETKKEKKSQGENKDLDHSDVLFVSCGILQNETGPTAAVDNACLKNPNAILYIM